MTEPDPEQALGQLYEALNLKPRATLVDSTRLASAYESACGLLQQGKMEQALAQFQDLVQSAPLEQRFQFGLGLCLQGCGRIADALRHYGVAYVLDASDAACAFRIGECLAAAGLQDDAREALEAAMTLSHLPTNSPLVRELAEAALARL